ncbi:hypothetical protein Plec18167_006264 [Paecilomyces lecythidis]|uniref:F-box domain-containing protein n=1 Tax=Paecilomyces lecythidis TaxID=3004212 RepID=A0ABR3XDB7_9EURO
MSLQNLPTEILLMCFKELDDHRDPYRFSALTNTRLTCKRFDQLVIPMLFSEITAHFMSTSLQALEKISQNPAIAACITKVNIALPCYDPAMLEDFTRFIECRIDSIDSDLPIPSDPISKKVYDNARMKCGYVQFSWGIVASGDYDDAFHVGDYDRNDYDRDVELLKEGFRQYEKIYRDQEKRKPVLLLSTIFKRLNNIQEINIDDNVSQTGYINERGALVLAWNSGYVPASQWFGKEVESNIATSWKLISDIFYCMETSSVRPTRFSLELLHPPLNSSALKQSPECLACISHVLKNTISIRIDIWTDVNEKPDDLTFLGDFLKAMCDSSSMQEFELRLPGRFFHWDATSVLPLGETTWGCLKSLTLEGTIFSHEEFQMLLRKCDKNVLERIHSEDIVIRSFSRQDFADTQRHFPNLTWTGSIKAI